MASPAWWTWVWASSESWWWTGRPAMLLSMRLERVGHDWATELTDQTQVDFALSDLVHSSLPWKPLPLQTLPLPCSSQPPAGTSAHSSLPHPPCPCWTLGTLFPGSSHPAISLQSGAEVGLSTLVKSGKTVQLGINTAAPGITHLHGLGYQMERWEVEPAHLGTFSLLAERAARPNYK